MKTIIGARSSTLHYYQDYRKIQPTKNNVLVKDMEFGERQTLGGIIIIDDDKKGQGIRPRWAEVVAIGPKHVGHVGLI